MQDFDAFPEPSATVEASKSPHLQLFTQTPQLQATQVSVAPSMSPLVVPAPVPPVATPVSPWSRVQAPPSTVPVPSTGPPPVLASRLQDTDMDSDDEMIGADPDEIAFARGDQEEEAPDWFDCEKLW